MRYFSTNDRSHNVNFKEAVFKSLPPDNGLYFPESIPKLSKEWIDSLESHSKFDIGFEIARHFIGNEIAENDLYNIIENTVNFDIPLKNIHHNIFSLELFHGPTWAFKDIGARFLSRCMEYFTALSGDEVTILVATSGDTGSAVAAGFHNVSGIKVNILYPKGKVSAIQKRQLTTWGNNIQAFEVDGTFDDCQKMVKTAFLDNELNKKLNLSSANSINIARLIPQMFYYFYAVQQLNSENTVICVPSGNYGNLTAGLFAWKMGLPVKRFITANNTNHVISDYLLSGKYEPSKSIQTYANAMDVGNPSNFVRMLELFGHDHQRMTKLIEGFFLLDKDILSTINQVYNTHHYMLDPHGAIGYSGLESKLKAEESGVFLETAHPFKFIDVIEKALGYKIDCSSKTGTLENKKEHFTSISTDYNQFVSMVLD